MEKEFIPYELALELKELGFNEPCIMFYDNPKYPRPGTDDDYWGDYTGFQKWNSMPNSPWKPFKPLISAPLWQQAFDWFRTEHNLHFEIFQTPASSHWNMCVYNLSSRFKTEKTYYNFISYEQARLECLKKLIEIVVYVKYN